ncbi:MAG: ribosome-associated translation inhibitor RaiA [Kiritimatiellaceae bacterium]|nr:ribosome-associated translation inhibitor RaiA [Kiritimatiellaceae bacterium]
MQVHITGRNVPITDSIREHIYEKIERCWSGLSRVHDVQVILELQKRTHTSEIVVTGKDHIHIEAKEESENMYTSIDQSIEKIERQLRKKREKVQDHH